MRYDYVISGKARFSAGYKHLVIFFKNGFLERGWVGELSRSDSCMMIVGPTPWLEIA